MARAWRRAESAPHRAAPELCPPGRPLPTHRRPRVLAPSAWQERRRPRSRHGARSSAQPAEPAAGRCCRASGEPGGSRRGLPAEPRAGPARTSEAAVCQAEIHPLQSRRKAPLPSTALGGGELLQLLLPRPNYAIRTRRDSQRRHGAPGTAQGKRPRATATGLPPSLPGKRKAPLGVPETLDYPHRAARRAPRPHTRGRGRARRRCNQRAGGRALLPRPRRGSGRRETPPPAAAASLLPLFLPD